jgi:hypothetical protein
MFRNGYKIIPNGGWLAGLAVELAGKFAGWFDGLLTGRQAAWLAGWMFRVRKTTRLMKNIKRTFPNGKKKTY